MRDADAVLACLKRALRLANAAAQQASVAPRASAGAPAPTWLFVDVLNAYVGHAAAGNTAITPETLQARGVGNRALLSAQHALGLPLRRPCCSWLQQPRV